MNYLEINKDVDGFFDITLDDILYRIKPLVKDYIWSIQIIEGEGNIEKIIDMNILDLENYCDTSAKGFIVDFSDLIKIAETCKDITEILIIACETIEKIPKAYEDKNWEKICKVIISREDSSIWWFYSQNSKIMDEFKKLIP